MNTTVQIALWLAGMAVVAVATFATLVHTDKKARHSGAQDTRATLNHNLRELLAYDATLRLSGFGPGAEDGIAVLDKNFQVVASATDAITATEIALNRLRVRVAKELGLPAQTLTDLLRVAEAEGVTFETLRAVMAGKKLGKPHPQARP